ncbi:polyisoprenoid-binding protein YceI [Panacagrimonas perspica]|uniref:Polyisoprenoid-binding protein YceI n=1 Tax=Panacagrimonas perspica TaxID=381431 RepID=A0A4S3K2Z1_9GAMM|nr:YceI family protein [Panacagrimonas perspica]TDU28763.1 polyisoprenoid-binding protein YceI [Panacagrimonas perspica]THD02395.1 polyisoprenoid-binding protein [Panacagrimonas perspica]
MRLSLFVAAALAAGVAVPALAAPVNYTIEPGHTYPSFKAAHMGISFWRGKFNKSSGKVTLDREGKTGTVDITIDAASVDFGHDKMNEHAMNEDFFNVGKYPTITYKGTIKFEKGEPDEVDGQLTLLGVTKPVKLDIESFKCIQHPFYKKEVCGADAEGEFNRADFGMTKAADGELGKVKIQIQVEALRDS